MIIDAAAAAAAAATACCSPPPPPLLLLLKMMVMLLPKLLHLSLLPWPLPLLILLLLLLLMPPPLLLCCCVKVGLHAPSFSKVTTLWKTASTYSITRTPSKLHNLRPAFRAH